MIADSDYRQGDACVMTIDPVAVIIVRARKSNHLPRRQIFVAAIDRIGKKAISRISEDLDEELVEADCGPCCLIPSWNGPIM